MPGFVSCQNPSVAIPPAFYDLKTLVVFFLKLTGDFGVQKEIEFFFQNFLGGSSRDRFEVGNVTSLKVYFC